MIDWNGFDGSTPAASEEARALLGQLAQALERPALAERADAMLGHVLAPPIDGATFDRVRAGLATLFATGDEEPGRLFAWLAADRTRERLERFVAEAPPGVGRFLRNVWTLHGDELGQAFRRWREVPDDWEVVHREVYLDLITEQVRIETTITKFDGEQLKLAGDAASLLALTTNLLRSLNAIPPATSLPDQVLVAYREQTEAFERLLATGAAMAEAAEDATEPA